jgi:hypothetical protein
MNEFTKYVSWDDKSFGLVNSYRHFEGKYQTTRRNFCTTVAIVSKLAKLHFPVFLYNVHSVELAGGPHTLNNLQFSALLTFTERWLYLTLILLMWRIG